MLVEMPCFCSTSHARMPSHVDAICDLVGAMWEM